MGRKERKRQAALEKHNASMQDEIERMLASLSDFRAFKKHASNAQIPIALERGEYPLCLGENAFRLIEAQPTPGKIKGFAGGVGIPIGPTSINIGGVKGKYEPGDTELQVTDPQSSRTAGGNVVVTNKRLVYLSKNRTAEWPYKKIISINHQDNNPDPYDALMEQMVSIPAATIFHMRDRSYVSGIAYNSRDADLMRIRLEFGLAIHNRKRKAFAEQLTKRLGEL